MKQPAVSVIIPAYNHAKYISHAIESVLQQTFSDFELVIIDDGSTDNTFDIIRSYSDPRILAETQPNVDAPTTINRAMAKTCGTHIALLNSDDVYHPERLERMLTFMKENRCDYAISDLIPITSNGEEITNIKHPWHVAHSACKRIYAETNDMLSALFNANLMVTTSNLMLSRKAVETTGIFNPSLRYLHDYDYLFRLAHQYANQHPFLDEKLAYYRLHRNNTLKKGAITARQQDIDLIQHNIQLCMPTDQHKRLHYALNHFSTMTQELQWHKLASKNPTLIISKLFKHIFNVK